MHHTIETQLSVEVANTPGEIARISDLLASRNLSVNAMSTAEGSGRGYFRFLSDEPDRAETTLRENGFSLASERVIVVRLDDQKGKLVAITNALAQMHINIDYFYASVDHVNPSTRLVMKVENIPLATRILEEIAKNPVESPAPSYA